MYCTCGKALSIQKANINLEDDKNIDLELKTNVMKCNHCNEIFIPPNIAKEIEIKLIECAQKINKIKES